MSESSTPSDVLRMAAFPDGGAGGNPAGVVLAAHTMTDAQMLALAAEIGYSETAFVVEGPSGRDVGMRYFTPIAEIPFCGHATVATAVALSERHGPGRWEFSTPSGPISVVVEADGGGLVATFTSAPPRVSELDDDVLARLLTELSLTPTDLHEDYPPRESWAGNPHPVLVLKDRKRFDEFGFDPDRVRALMDEQGWTGTVTVMLAPDKAGGEWEARNPFPVGDITEDPATGSAAASFGAYLRDVLGAAAPETVTIRQGRHVHAPSVLRVTIPADGGISVSGTARTLWESHPLRDGQGVRRHNPPHILSTAVRA